MGLLAPVALAVLVAQGDGPATRPEEIGALLRMLRSAPDPDERQRAASRLVRSEVPGAVAGALAALRETDDAEATRAVLRALREVEVGLEEVLRLWRGGEEGLRREARSTLEARRARGPALVSRLREILESESTPGELRAAAIGAAGALRLLELAPAVARDLDDSPRAAAARSVVADLTRRRFRDRAEFEAWWASRTGLTREALLERELDAVLAELAEAQRRAIEGNPDRLVEALGHDLREVRKAAASGIAGLRPEGVPAGAAKALLEAYRREVEPEVRLALLPALGRCAPSSPEARVVLLEALDSTDPAERSAACQALAPVAQEAAVERALLDRLEAIAQGGRAEPVEVRRALLAALSPLVRGEGGDRARALLGRLFAVEGDVESRKAAARLAGAVGDARSIAELGNVARSAAEDPTVRFAAVRAVVQIAERLEEPSPALAVLHALVEDRDFALRNLAASSLGEIASSASVPVVAARLEAERDPKVLETLAGVAARLGVGSLLVPLLASADHAEESVREAIYRAARACAGKNAERLLSAGGAFEIAGDARRAAALLERVLEIAEPGSEPDRSARSTLASIALENEEGTDGGEVAVETFRRVIEWLEPVRLGPADDVRLAQAYEALDREEDSLRAYARAVHDAPPPDSPGGRALGEALRRFGGHLLARGKFARAVEVFETLLLAHPDDAALEEARARALAGAGRRPRAIAAMRALLERAPGAPVERRWARIADLATWLLEEGERREAARLLGDGPPEEVRDPAVRSRLLDLRERLRAGPPG